MRTIQNMILMIMMFLLTSPMFAQNPAARQARCPDCFVGGPIFTPYATQIYGPAYYGGFGGFRNNGGVWAGVAATAAGAGIAVAVDEIQQRRAEAAEDRRDRRDQQKNRSQSSGNIQLRNCRTYESTDKNAPPVMICEDKDGNKITLEREK